MQRRKGTRLAVMQLCWRSGTRRILSEFIASRGLLWIATRPMQEDRPWQQSSDNSAKPTNKRCWRLLGILLSSRKSMRSVPSSDRKSVVSGKSVSVRVDLGGGRIIKKKTQKDQ